MITSRLIFAGINNVKSSDEAQAVALGRLSNASEALTSVIPAQYVRQGLIEMGIAFFLEAPNGENIFNRVVKLNRILGGGIHSVETNDYGSKAYCFYAPCSGQVDEIAHSWQEHINHHWEGAFVDCIVHQAGKKSCYVSGILSHRQIQGSTDEEKAYSLVTWQQRIRLLFKQLKCLQNPRFVPTCYNNLD